MKKINILNLIKIRTSSRKYTRKRIPSVIVNRIIEAGIWGPSVLRLQPSRFYVIKDSKRITKIFNILTNKSTELESAPRAIMRSTANTIAEAKLVIAVYNSGLVVKRVNKVNPSYEKFAKMAELEAIGASIQNMMLVAADEGIGACWFDMPLLCQEYIKKVTGSDEQLIALLTFGYSSDQGTRSQRVGGIATKDKMR